MRRTTSAPDPAPRSALTRLLDVESRLEAMLAQARLDAEEVLQRGKARAEARASSLAVELASADAELSARLTMETEARIAEEEAALAARRHRYETVGSADLQDHAAWVVEEVLRIAGEESA